MKIGIFDSGVGGLVVTQSLIAALPEYDYVYLGDTARVPYGNRSQEKIYEFTLEALEFLFKKECELVIIACNTASAEALRKIQQEYLPVAFPERKVLGVLIPAAEEAARQTKNKKIGVLATASTVHSETFVKEVQKLVPDTEVFQEAAPLLVPLIENNALKWSRPILEEYLQPLLQKDIDTLILGCTHYPVLKEEIRKLAGEGISVISQDEIIPEKLKTYLAHHPEIAERLSTESSRDFYVTDLTESTDILAREFFTESIHFQKCSLGEMKKTRTR